MIKLILVGEVDRSTLEALKKPLKDSFSQDVEWGDGITLPEESLDKHRGQYLAHDILTSLPLLREREDRVLGVVDVDIYAYGLNFIFGEAEVSGKRALISLARLRQEFYNLLPDNQLFQERVLKEAVHELGHTYGLGHCPNSRCVMHFSNNIQDTDVKGSSFCSRCQRAIPKKHANF